MAQPMLALSTAPTLIGDSVAPRHVDLRPFVLQSGSLYVTHRRPHARRDARRFAGSEFLAGRRKQGHLDRGGSMLILSACCGDAVTG